MSGGRPQPAVGRPAVGRPAAPAASQDRAFPGDAYYGAPDGAGRGAHPARDPAPRRTRWPPGPSPSPPPAAPNTGQVLAPSGTTRSWSGRAGDPLVFGPPCRRSRKLESFEEFWAEDDNDAEYEGLFPGEDPDFDPPRAQGQHPDQGPRRFSRTRGRRRDTAMESPPVAGALLGVLDRGRRRDLRHLRSSSSPSHPGPTHHMATPPRIGLRAYRRHGEGDQGQRACAPRSSR